VVFSGLKEGSLLTRLLYRGEHWIYRKADELVFTFNGGKQYILDKGWEKDVSLDKIHYINNGIDLDGYEEKVQTGAFSDEDLDGDAFKIVYAGAMGPPNQINRIVDAALELQRRNVKGVRFILFGAGMCRDEEEARCRAAGLSNVVFKGTIEKRRVPYALSRSDATIIMIEDSVLQRYGTSENKIFDYLAAKKAHHLQRREHPQRGGGFGLRFRRWERGRRGGESAAHGPGGIRPRLPKRWSPGGTVRFRNVDDADAGCVRTGQ
jgi:glycosyltransferase involved in cell wall biosynthesis